MTAAPALRLFCFHHAGAGVSAFARWKVGLGDVAEVVSVLLPGRDERVREPRITDPGELVAELDRRVGALADAGPYALYGHSLGGLVAHHWGRWRHERGARPPELVVVGASSPPHLASPLLPGAGLPDVELIALLVALRVLPAEAQRHPEIWQRRVLPALRDDLRLAAALCSAAGPPLSAPLLAVAGRGDPIAPITAMAQWDRYTEGAFRLSAVPGDHFFVRESSLPRLLRPALRRVVPAVPA